MATAKKVAKKSPATKKVVKKVAKKVSTGEYHIVIKANGQVFKTDAASVLEGLKAFVPPTAIKTKTIVTVTKGKKSHEQLINVFNARRSFNGNSTSLSLLASTLEKFING